MVCHVCEYIGMALARWISCAHVDLALIERLFSAARSQATLMAKGRPRRVAAVYQRTNRTQKRVQNS